MQGQGQGKGRLLKRGHLHFPGMNSSVPKEVVTRVGREGPESHGKQWVYRQDRELWFLKNQLWVCEKDTQLRARRKTAASRGVVRPIWRSTDFSIPCRGHRCLEGGRALMGSGGSPLSLSLLLVAVGPGCGGIVPGRLLAPWHRRTSSQLVAGLGHHWVAVLGGWVPSEAEGLGRREC